MAALARRGRSNRFLHRQTRRLSPLFDSKNLPAVGYWVFVTNLHQRGAQFSFSMYTHADFRTPTIGISNGQSEDQQCRTDLDTLNDDERSNEGLNLCAFRSFAVSSRFGEAQQTPRL